MSMKIEVLGGGREVGRTAILVEYSGKSILFDYGVSFNEEDIPVLPMSVQPSKLSAVLVTHAHLDHVGAAPFLYVSARPPAVMTELTKELAKVMIEDMLKLAGYYLPFEYPELEAFLSSVQPLRLGSELIINDIRIEAINAGHIPGSAMYRVEIGNRSILFTGDVNTIDTRLVKGAHREGLEANILIIESTYGNVDHPPRKRVEDKFIDTIRSVVEDGGTVLIPAFALGRAQEILALLAEKMPYANVYYDGMARRILEIFLSYREYINRVDLLEKVVRIFTAVQSSSMRRKICREPGSIIVAPAGMLKGGPSVYYLKRMGENSRNALILVSYQAKSTPGRKLLSDGCIEEGGSKIKARVYWYDFSSHAGVSGLLEIVKSVRNLEKVVIIHGSDNSAFELAYRIKENLGIDVEVPSVNQVITV